jgi:hypothetical protein
MQFQHNAPVSPDSPSCMYCRLFVSEECLGIPKWGYSTYSVCRVLLASNFVHTVYIPCNSSDWTKLQGFSWGHITCMQRSLIIIEDVKFPLTGATIRKQEGTCWGPRLQHNSIALQSRCDMHGARRGFQLSFLTDVAWSADDILIVWHAVGVQQLYWQGSTWSLIGRWITTLRWPKITLRGPNSLWCG